MDNKFLQAVNLDALQRETGKTLEELADMAEIGHKVIYKWRYMHKDGSRPTYNTIVRLIGAGASVETLFGVDYKAGKTIIEKPASQDQVMEAVKKALSDLGKSL